MQRHHNRKFSNDRTRRRLINAHDGGRESSQFIRTNLISELFSGTTGVDLVDEVPKGQLCGTIFFSRMDSKWTTRRIIQLLLFIGNLSKNTQVQKAFSSQLLYFQEA